jgi:uncharacterized protein YbcI
MREELHTTMHGTLVDAVEILTGCTVPVLTSATSLDPDVETHVFALNRSIASTT